MQRKRLSEILSGRSGGADWMNNDWGGIAPAPEFGAPVPRGHYITHVIDGALFNAGTGTPGYKVTHEIIEGEHKGRRLWHDIWLSQKAQGQAVRDLPKLGIKSKQQLEQPIPSRRIRCKVFVVTRKDDAGGERNEIRHFEVIGIDPPPAADPYAPPGAPSEKADNGPAEGEGQ